MSDNDKCESDSDVSSNSSWTVLDENEDASTPNSLVWNLTPDRPSQPHLRNDEDQSVECVTVAGQPSTDLQYLMDTIDVSDSDDQSQSKGESTEHGCLTYKEYLDEQELLQDYDFSNYCDKSRRSAKVSRRKKCKADALGTLTVISTVMAVAGVSFLCLLSPSNYTLSSKEIQKLRALNGSAETVVNFTSMPTCPVFDDKNERLLLSDPQQVLSTLLVKNATTPRRAANSIRKNKMLRSLGSINLLDTKQPLDKEYQKPQSSIRPINNRLIKKNANAISKVYGPELPDFSLKKNTDIDSADTATEASIVKDEQNSNDGFSPKFLCHVVQDLMLLRMLGNMNQTKRKVERQRKTSKQAVKVSRQKKETLYSKNTSDNQSYEEFKKYQTPGSITTKPNQTESKDHCPSAKKRSCKRSLQKIVSKCPGNEVNLPKDIEHSNGSSNKEAISNTACVSSCKALESLSVAKEDYLKRLRKAQEERMEQLRAARERRQESLLRIMDERKHYVEKVKNATNLRQPYMPSFVTYKMGSDLQKVKAEHDLTSRAANNCNGVIMESAGKSEQQSKQSGDRVSPYGNVLSEYVFSQRKYMQMKATYWSKREECFNARIAFLKEATSAIKLISQNFNNNKTVAKREVEQIVEKATLAFENDVAIQNLKKKLNSRLNDSHYSIVFSYPNKCVKLNKDSTGEIASTALITCPQPTCTQVYQINNEGNALVPIPRQDIIKSDAYYNIFFGKAGNQIRKKDILCWYRNRTKKWKHQRDIIKRESGRNIKKVLTLTPKLN